MSLRMSRSCPCVWYWVQSSRLKQAFNVTKVRGHGDACCLRLWRIRGGGRRKPGGKPGGGTKSPKQQFLKWSAASLASFNKAKTKAMEAETKLQNVKVPCLFGYKKLLHDSG